MVSVTYCILRPVPFSGLRHGEIRPLQCSGGRRLQGRNQEVFVSEGGCMGGYAVIFSSEGSDGLVMHGGGRDVTLLINRACEFD